MNVFIAYIGPISLAALLTLIGISVFAFVAAFIANIVNGLDEALEEGISFSVLGASLVTGLYVAGLVIFAILGIFGVMV